MREAMTFNNACGNDSGEEVARLLGMRVSNTADSLPVPGTTIPRRQGRGPAILSATQQRLWFFAKLDPEDIAYNQSQAYRLTGPIDVEALRRALKFLTARHEILRTTYTMVDGEPRQIVHDDLNVDLQFSDLTAFLDAEQRDELDRLLLSDSQTA